MPKPPPKSVPCPRWLLVLGSILIVGHLIAVASGALAAQSGPWPQPDGMVVPATAPQFARAINEIAGPYYLKWLKMADNYHFPSNRPLVPGVFVEIRLKDASGMTKTTVTLPSARANGWVRYRQQLFLQGLLQETSIDQPIQPPAGEAVAAPGRQLQMIPIWNPPEGGVVTMRNVPEHLIPRDRPVWGPTELSLVLARSLSRHLCRIHDATSAEFLRHSRLAYHPAFWLMDEPPTGASDELIANYGEFPK
jgi:hypothetical protein